MLLLMHNRLEERSGTTESDSICLWMGFEWRMFSL